LSRSFKTKVTLPPEPWPIDALLEHTRKRQRDLLGLAHRSGVLKSGGNVISSLMARSWPRYLVIATDAGERVRRDWEERAGRKGLEILPTLLSCDELGAALGRTGSRSVAAVASGGPASALRKTLKMGAAFI
jgi:ribosomal protein L7Ae-like RNA K-turn-binding protein